MPQVTHRVWNRPHLVPDPIYLDSSVLVGYLASRDRLHARSIDFLTAHLSATKTMFVSLLTIDETMYVLARHQIATARRVPYSQINVAQEVKKNPLVLAPFVPNIKHAIQTSLAWLRLVGCGAAEPQEILDGWFDRLLQIGGMHDALHIVLAEKNGAKTLVTGDKDFRAVKTLPFSLVIAEL